MRGVASKLGHPFGRTGSVHGLLVHPECLLGRFAKVAIGFVHDHEIREFKQSALDALQRIAAPGEQEEQGVIHHIGDRRLTLSDPNRLDQYAVVSGRLTQLYGLACPQGNPAEVTPCWGRADERIIRAAQLFHPRFISQHRTAGRWGGGIHGEHGHAVSLAYVMHPESVDQGAFTSTWESGYTHAPRGGVYRVDLGQDHPRGGLIGGAGTLDQGNCAGERRSVAALKAIKQGGYARIAHRVWDAKAKVNLCYLSIGKTLNLLCIPFVICDLKFFRYAEDRLSFVLEFMSQAFLKLYRWFQ